VDRTITSLGLSVDLRAEPWRYPGPFLPFSCLQVCDTLVPVGDDPLGQLRRHSDTEAHFVIAVGSNTSPDVVRRKFERHGAPTTVLHLRGRLDGVALGHSAHVSQPGYVPATPYPKAGSTIEVVVSALTAHQLLCLDETEPNYNRVTVARDRARLDPPVPLPARLHLYESKWGTLADGTGTPVPFTTQDAVLARLAEWGAVPRHDDPRRLARTLGQRDDLRRAATEILTRYARRH
jgi:hypothetical protein